MHRSSSIIAVVMIATGAFAAPAPEPTVLHPEGLGSVRVGMVLDAVASAAGNFDLIEVQGRIGSRHCYAIHSRVVDESHGIVYVGIDSPAVQRIDVRQPDEGETGNDRRLAREVRTREGIKLGDPESRIGATYSDRPEFRPPTKVSSTYYLAQRRHGPYGYAFVVNDGIVVELRSGHVMALVRQDACG
jgi:hypothetical protein